MRSVHRLQQPWTGPVCTAGTPHSSRLPSYRPATTGPTNRGHDNPILLTPAQLPPPYVGVGNAHRSADRLIKSPQHGELLPGLKVHCDWRLRGGRGHQPQQHGHRQAVGQHERGYKGDAMLRMFPRWLATRVVLPGCNRLKPKVNIPLPGCGRQHRLRGAAAFATTGRHRPAGDDGPRGLCGHHVAAELVGQTRRTAHDAFVRQSQGKAASQGEPDRTRALSHRTRPESIEGCQCRGKG